MGFLYSITPAPEFRGTMRPAAGVTLEDVNLSPPQAAAEREAADFYDDFQWPKTFPTPKRDDDGETN